VGVGDGEVGVGDGEVGVGDGDVGVGVGVGEGLVGDGDGDADAECVGVGDGERPLGCGRGTGGTPAGAGDGPNSTGNGRRTCRPAALRRPCAAELGDELPGAVPLVPVAVADAALRPTGEPNVTLYSRAPPTTRTTSAADEAAITTITLRRLAGWAGKPSLSRLPIRRVTLRR
jgi:hypothetical protein